MEANYLHKTAYELLKRAKRVLLVAHRSPDGDTLGAVTALLRWCDREGIEATPFCVDALSTPYFFLYGSERFTSDKSVVTSANYDLIVVCDCSDTKIAGLQNELAEAAKNSKIINLDHHVTNVRFGHLNIVNVKASSVCEMTYQFLYDCKVEICAEIATSLLTGILTDTNNFSNSATSGQVISVAAELLRHGARQQEITRKVIRNKPVESLRLWGVVLSRLKYDPELGVASTAIFNDDLPSGASEEYITGVSNFLHSVLDAKVILVLRETVDGQVRGSLRSVEGADVSEVARKMGGGGHRKAAGFSVSGRIVEYEGGWQVVKN